MAIQILMDHTSDTRHYFDPKNAKALLKAEERFKELTGAGFTAATRTAAGEASVTRSFDPTAEETLFIPRLIGGKTVSVRASAAHCEGPSPAFPDGKPWRRPFSGVS
jgi:hypothetical protein